MDLELGPPASGPPALDSPGLCQPEALAILEVRAVEAAPLDAVDACAEARPLPQLAGAVAVARPPRRSFRGAARKVAADRRLAGDAGFLGLVRQASRVGLVRQASRVTLGPRMSSGLAGASARVGPALVKASKWAKLKTASGGPSGMKVAARQMKGKEAADVVGLWQKAAKVSLAAPRPLAQVLMSSQTYEKLVESRKQSRDHETMVHDFKLRTASNFQQGDAMWIIKALSSPRLVRLVAPRHRKNASGWSHAARIALLLATLAEEQGALPRDADEAPRLREEHVLSFLRKTAPALVSDVSDHRGVADELFALKALLEATHAAEPHLLFACADARDAEQSVRDLSLAEREFGWRRAVGACMSAHWKRGGAGGTRDPASASWLDASVLDPDSATATLWALFVFAVVGLQVIAVPQAWSFRTWEAWRFVFWATDAVFVGDIFVQLKTAFAYDVEANEDGGDAPSPPDTSSPRPNDDGRSRRTVEWDRGRIFQNYVKCCFVVDVLALVPLALALARHFSTAKWRVPVAVAALRLVKTLKVLRPFQADGGASRRRRKRLRFLQRSEYGNIGLLLVFLVVAMHFIACSWHVVTDRRHWTTRYEAYSDHAIKYKNVPARWLYVMALYESVLILMGEEVSVKRDGEVLFVIISVILCAVVLALVFGQVGILIATRSERPLAFQKRMAQLQSAMQHGGLPRVLQHRISAYYAYLWTEHKTLDGRGRSRIAAFLPELSPNLAREVRVFWCRDMVLNVPFFKLCPPQVVHQLLRDIVVEFYMPDDYIVVVGEMGHEMFFIKAGTVDVFRTGEADVPPSPTKRNSLHRTSLTFSAGRRASLHPLGGRKGSMLGRLRAQTSRFSEAPVFPSVGQGDGDAKASAEASKTRRASVHGGAGPRRSSSNMLAARSRAPSLSRSSKPAAPPVLAKTVQAPTRRAEPTRRVEREQIVCSLHAGAYFGDVALLARCRRTATVKARTFVTCAVVKRVDMEAALKDFPSVWEKSLATLRAKYGDAVQQGRQTINVKSALDQAADTASGAAAAAASDAADRVASLELKLQQLDADLPQRIAALIDNCFNAAPA
mmetsp:Transcript_20562/g.71003  ORF Transcript_20562/g.71003 Transcript_20562/m.71003 type:complete len:1071 (+) Transcript_20562:38-3250(+)